ncbi:hypothetical protein V7S43_004448 [Phytophthora oleae]|uniref:BZIP domain-containing protein n=1 Tax=Phytophthora oleae TaxID=2107226 RepID=A0ABD3FTP1_9STRA
MSTTNKSNNSPTKAQSNQLPRLTGSKRDAESVSMTNSGEPETKRQYYGKCQYKTGKCFNERTLKRNGEAHSLCEEHRVKQNLIQRRSDRKYQTVHAVRRRERSQRRAVLKKQVSMAVAQQLFYEHQAQKTLGIPLPQHHPLHPLMANAATPIVGLAPPIQVPQASAYGQNAMGSPLMLAFKPQGDHENPPHVKAAKGLGVAERATTGSKEESSPTGIDDVKPDSFLNIAGRNAISALRNDEAAGSSGMSDSLGYMPIMSCSGDKETWSEDDIEFLQTILLA